MRGLPILLRVRVVLAEALLIDSAPRGVEEHPLHVVTSPVPELAFHWLP